MSMDKVKGLMKSAATGWLATTDGKRASLRPMSAWAWSGTDIVCATPRSSAKVAEIGKCSDAEFGFAVPGWEHVRVSGSMALDEDPGVKKMLFDAFPPLQQMFKGPTDPNLAVLRMKVGRVRLFAMAKLGYDEVALG